MALLRSRRWIVVVGALATAACYAPDVRDCTLGCTSELDCASGQVCGPARLCAAPEVASTCAPPRDAADAADNDAAITVDAAPRDAAAVHVSIEVVIIGKGTVQLVGGGACTSPPMGPACALTAIAGVPVTVRATPGADDTTFTGWSGACAGNAPTCTFTPVQPTTALGARFDR